jgi:hypothetical protein
MVCEYCKAPASPKRKNLCRLCIDHDCTIECQDLECPSKYCNGTKLLQDWTLPQGIDKTEHADPIQAMFNGLYELNRYLLKLCARHPDKADGCGVVDEAKAVRLTINEVHTKRKNKYQYIDRAWLVDHLNQTAIDVETMRRK